MIFQRFLTISRRNSFVNKTLLPPRLHFFSGGGTGTATDSPNSPLADETGCDAHPWPEWQQLVRKLETKGFFKDSCTTDSNRIKNACLLFARQRADILRSLPVEDMRAVLEYGCPNLFPKVVNSAKRLRAFLRINEGDVCSGCNLQGSCDKAKMSIKEDEEPRTADIMRVILYYALDPIVLSSGTNHQIEGHVQRSVRNLLSELINLSDTAIDPLVLDTASELLNKKEQPLSQKEPSQKLNKKKKKLRSVESREGDWLCSNCNFMNFGRNIRCLKCKVDWPKEELGCKFSLLTAKSG